MDFLWTFIVLGVLIAWVLIVLRRRGRTGDRLLERRADVDTAIGATMVLRHRDNSP
jgi:hypothetical protein